MADGQQGIAISSGFTLSEDDFLDKDFRQTVLANALANIPAERRYDGKPIFVLEPANRGLYFMNVAKDGFVKLSSVAQANLVAIIPPTVNNDTTEGYDVSSLWLDTVANEYYRCSDATAGAAVWAKTTLTADELATVAITGQYSDLLGTPALVTPAGTVSGAVQYRNGAGDDFEADDRLIMNGANGLVFSLTGNGSGFVVRKNTLFRVFTGIVDNDSGTIVLYDTLNAQTIRLIAENSALNNFIKPAIVFGDTLLNDNAQLEIVSTEKGFLKPRMSTAQKTILGALLGLGDEGMEVYDLDTLTGFKWDGTQWVEDGTGGGVEERIMFDSNLDTVRVIYYNGNLVFGAFNIDTVKISTLEFETSLDGITWVSHGTIAASGTPPVALNSWIVINGSGNWYLRLSVVYKAAQTLPTGTQFTFER